jgi:hypothetical protein
VLAARLEFDPRTGKPTGLPATEPVAIYRRVEGGDVSSTSRPY